jgi:hypothetical protein
MSQRMLTLRHRLDELSSADELRRVIRLHDLLRSQSWPFW